MSKNTSFVRGDSTHYRVLARKSSLARIRRHISADIRVCREGGVIPFKSRDTDVGYDLSVVEDAAVRYGDRVRIPTGVQVKCPPGYFYMIVPRSSATQRGLYMDGPAIIDPTYTGELFVTVSHSSCEDRSSPENKREDIPEIIRIKKGERLAQLVFLPVISVTMNKVEEFDHNNNDRAEEGFGSTGR